MTFSILSTISPLFTLMMFLFIPALLMNTGKHLYSFLDTIKRNGLVVFAKKIKLFQTKVRFLGYDISKGQIRPIDRAIQFVDKFPDVITNKTQLQRFLGSLNYVADFYKDMRKQCKLLFDQLQSNPPPWSDVHTSLVKQIKSHVKTLPCLGIPTVDAFKIVETDAISQETLIEFMFSVLNLTSLQSTIQKELAMMIQEGFLHQEKILFMSHFYIVDFATSMLYIMNMHVMIILHGILTMIILLMPLILNKFSQCKQLNQPMHLLQAYLDQPYW